MDKSKIFFSSDLHFGHTKDFLWSPRGFTSSEEHDAEIIRRWNEKVSPEDIVYILGDLMLEDNMNGMIKLLQLNGKFYIIRGNHDTNTRLQLYQSRPDKIKEITEAITVRFGKQDYFLCHYPTFTANYDDKPYHSHLINLFGHTHQKEKFYNNNPFMYNIGLDAHNCYPVSLEEIENDIHLKIQELYKEKMQQRKDEEEYYKNGLGYFDTHPISFYN